MREINLDSFYEIMQNSFKKIGKVGSKRKEIQLNDQALKARLPRNAVMSTVI